MSLRNTDRSNQHGEASPRRLRPEGLFAVRTVAAAIASGAVAALVFGSLYPWSTDPSVNPYAQSLAIVLATATVGLVAGLATGLLGGVFYLLRTRRR